MDDVKSLISLCRKLGFKAAMPNDGWVDRDDNFITMTNPYYDDNCKVGDKALLAFPGDFKSFRPIILTGVKENVFDIYGTKRFYFQDIEPKKHKKIKSIKNKEERR